MTMPRVISISVIYRHLLFYPDLPWHSAKDRVRSVGKRLAGILQLHRTVGQLKVVSSLIHLLRDIRRQNTMTS